MDKIDIMKFALFSDTDPLGHIGFYYSQAWLARLKGDYPVAQAYEKQAREATHILEAQNPIQHLITSTAVEQSPILVVA